MGLAPELRMDLRCAFGPNSVFKQDFWNIAKLRNTICPEPEISILAMRRIRSVEIQAFENLAPDQYRWMGDANTKKQLPFEPFRSRGRTPSVYDMPIFFYRDPST